MGHFIRDCPNNQGRKKTTERIAMLRVPDQPWDSKSDYEVLNIPEEARVQIKKQERTVAFLPDDSAHHLISKKGCQAEMCVIHEKKPILSGPTEANDKPSDWYTGQQSHKALHWTHCGMTYCPTHYEAKQEAGYIPDAPKKGKKKSKN